MKASFIINDLRHELTTASGPDIIGILSSAACLTLDVQTSSNPDVMHLECEDPCSCMPSATAGLGAARQLCELGHSLPVHAWSLDRIS